MQAYHILHENAKFRRVSSTAKIITVTSPAGGTGVTSVALAFAESLTSQGARTLYLPFDRYASNIAFESNCARTMTDVIFSIKTQKENLHAAIDSAIMQSSRTGVFYVDSSQNAYDMIEMTDAELLHFAQNAVKLDYDYIVFDLKTPDNKLADFLLSNSDYNFIVATGEEQVKDKILRMINTLEKADNINSTNVCDLTKILYNKFGSADKTYQTDYDLEIGINKFVNYQFTDCVAQIALKIKPLVVEITR
jgi:cellulose biosynthesis protein BcsQ